MHREDEVVLVPRLEVLRHQREVRSRQRLKQGCIELRAAIVPPDLECYLRQIGIDDHRSAAQNLNRDQRTGRYRVRRNPRSQ